MPAPVTPGAIAKPADRPDVLAFRRARGCEPRHVSAPADFPATRSARGARTTRRLRGIDAATLARYFQVDAGQSTGRTWSSAAAAAPPRRSSRRPVPTCSAAPARPGHLIDYLLRHVPSGNRIPAGDILATLLDGLSSIWPSGLMLRGIPIGDAGRHPAVRTGRRHRPDRAVSQAVAVARPIR